MKIAVWHNEDIHFEMIGYILEYLYNYDEIEVHVYVSIFFIEKNIGPTYVSWYNKFFNNKIKWFYHEPVIDTINYDAIFLITDSNKTYSTYLEDKYDKKIICIDHWYQTRCPKAVEHIGVRPLPFNVVTNPTYKYAFPCYNIISEYEKLEAIKREEKINVIFMGRFNAPSSTTFSFIENMENINFHYVNWDAKLNALKYLKYLPNLKIYNKLSQDELINLMLKSHYVFIYPNYIEGYPEHKTSAVLHMAFSTLCIPIIPKSWFQCYNFIKNSVFVYDDLEFIKLEKTIDLNKEIFYKILPFLVEERNFQIQHRNLIFSKSIKNICGIEPDILKDNLIINCKKKIFIEVSHNKKNYDNIEDEINKYNHIYLVDFDKENLNKMKILFKDINKISILQGDIFKSKVLKRIEAELTIVINIENTLDNSFFKLDKIINCINDRHYTDKIIIKDLNKLHNNVLNMSEDTNNYLISYLKKLSIRKPWKLSYLKYEESYVLEFINISIENYLFQICIKPFNYLKLPDFVKDKIKEKSDGINYILYNNDMIQKVLEYSDDIIRQKYDSLVLPQHKKDIIQMYLLYNYGGIFFDLDQEPLLSFYEMIYNVKNINEKKSEYEEIDLEIPTFVGMIPALKKDGLAVGFMAATSNNEIVYKILIEYLNASFENLEGGEYYILLCKLAGKVLKEYMNVNELNEGLYRCNSDCIKLVKEVWNEGDYNSCKAVYKEKVLFNSRYREYPWDLKS